MEFKDFFGADVKVGDRVLYTTNDRGSGLNHGRVLELRDVTTSGYDNNGKAKIAPLNKDGTLHMETRWVGGYERGNPLNYEETGRPVRPSLINYGSYEVYRLGE